MKKFSLAIFASLLLTACQGGDVKDTLGMKIDAPDEFAVERKPKLEVPPSFKLRPPSPGESPLNVADTRDMAKEQITGVKQTISGNSPAEKSFLNKLGADEGNADIRGVLTKEYPQTAELTTLQKIRSISDKNVQKTLVDPEKEKARLDANKQAKKPVNEGETPTKSTQDGKNVVDKIFN